MGILSNIESLKELESLGTEEVLDCDDPDCPWGCYDTFEDEEE